MKNVIVLLALVAVTSMASADVVVTSADWAPPTNGWMNVTAVEGDWGSGWDLWNLRPNEVGGFWFLQTNVNGSPTGT